MPESGSSTLVGREAAGSVDIALQRKARSGFLWSENGQQTCPPGLRARASQGGGKLTRHASHRRRPSSPTRHSLSSFREHSRHFRHFGWYLLPRGPSTVSFSVARTEQPAQIKSPPRPAGGRGRRENRDGSTEDLFGDEEGMLYFGGRAVELGRSRVEREVGRADGVSEGGAAGRAGLGDNFGRAHCAEP